MAESRVAINLPPVQPGWHSLTVDTHIHSLQVFFLINFFFFFFPSHHSIVFLSFFFYLVAYQRHN